MVRGPNPGDGKRSPVHYLAPAVLDSFPPPPGGTWETQGPRSPESPRSLRGPRSLAEIDPLADVALALEPESRGRSAWNGAGGRWLLWPLRVVLWAALLVIAFRGVTAIVFDDNSGPAGPSTAPATATSGSFPVSLAEAYAAEFGRVYLNANPQNQGQREQLLAAFVPASVAAAHPDLGWNGAGQLSLQSEQVAGITVQDPQHAVVTLLASVNDQLMELGVPVAASGSGVVVSGEPAWLPAPAQIPLPAQAAGRSDPVAHIQLMAELPAFFQAYANSDSAALNRFLAPGVRLAGLGGTMAFDSISALRVPTGGSTRQITVSVIWQPLSQGVSSGAKLQVTYSMSVAQQSSVKWYVKQIGASIEAVGAQ